MPDAGFANAAEAAGMLDASLDHLTAVDWASLGTAAHGEMLARLQRAQAKLTAVSAAVLSAFTAPTAPPKPAPPKARYCAATDHPPPGRADPLNCVAIPIGPAGSRLRAAW